MQFFRMRAMGGAAVVTLGDCIVDPSGEDSGKLASPKILAGHEDNLPFLTRIADEIHRYGAVASIELNHAGMLRASAGVQAWGPDYINFDETKTIAPLSDQSASDEPVYRKGEVLFMTEEMIETVVDAFGRAAEQAKTCGFEMAMIHAGHGWLIHQFLSPLTNHRTDRFGGSLENRARLLLMIIDRIRQYCGEDFLIEVRFSGTEYVEGGYTLKEGVEFAKLMDGKADLLHVSACNFYFPETECLMVPGMFKEEGHNLYLAEEIKKHVKHSHVVSVGAHRDPKKIEDILAAGKVDMIAVCRAVNADPQFVNKLKRNQEEEIRPCLRCNACIANYQTRITKCAINPTLDRPEDEVFPFLPTTPKRVLIAGGGPAGLEAAIVARDRGHEVILCEKTGMLGGLLRYARKVPFKRETQQYVDYMIAKAVRMGVDIRLNTEVTPELVKVIAPDFCIAAVGSKALIPPIPGVEKAHPIMDMYDGKVQVGQKVVIVGGGLAGTEAALELAMQGKQVTLVEMGIDVARDANSIQAQKQGPEYLLADGYNLIFAWEELKAVARDNLDAARQMLMEVLSNYQGFKQNIVILVFDAYRVPRSVQDVTKYHNIYVVYTKEAETADTYIERATYEIGRHHRVRVATSDGAEQLIILGHGALRLSASAFKAEVEQAAGQISAILAANNRSAPSQPVAAALERARRRQEDKP